MTRITKKPIHLQISPHRGPAVKLQAQKAKRLLSKMEEIFPSKPKIGKSLPEGYFTISVKNKEEGFIRPSTIISIFTGGAGFLGGSYGWFKYVMAEGIAKDLGIPAKDLLYSDYMTNPTLSKNYLSIICSGAIVGLIGICLPLLPRMLNNEFESQDKD